MPTGPGQSLTQQEILDLFERVLPPHYLEPLKDPGPGYELLQAYAKVAERLSQVVADFDLSAYILTATSGTLATGTVQFSRASVLTGTYTIQAGTVVKASNGGARFVTTQDCYFDVGLMNQRALLNIGDPNSYEIPVVAVATGPEWNLPGEVTALNGEVLPGDIDTVVRMQQNPPYSDANVTVYQKMPTTGGSDRVLDELGRDRGLPRQLTETDAAYRLRVRNLPDTVSIDAFKRLLDSIIFSLGYLYQLTEVWELEYQTCWDGPNKDGPVTAQGQYLATTFVLDEYLYPVSRPAWPPFRNRWLSEEERRGTVIVVLPNLATMSDVGMAFDDNAMTPAAHQTPIGKRAFAAYDVSNSLIAGALQGGLDGFDLQKQAVYSNIYDVLNEIKPGGCIVSLELQGE